MAKILVVDDEQSILDSMSMVLGPEGYDVDCSLNGESALQNAYTNDYDLILLDIKMPRMDGMEVLEKLMEYDKDLCVIMISGHGNIETAVEATKKGAYDFLQKPLPDLYELKLTIRNAIKFKQSKDQLRRVRKQFEESNLIVGNSEKIGAVRELIRKFAKQNQNVLITGESGTGKELVARQIHIESDRSEKPFIEINSANLTERKIGQELFGALTGGVFVKGKFEQAEGGTVFFDEISSLSTDVQAKLLEVIETNRIVRPGASADLFIDVRFIFATNANPEEEVEARNLREDFFHRINVLRINIPPLRERPEDIPVLIRHFADKVTEQSNLPHKTFSADAIDMLLSFRWPGNVRELKNLVERLIISTEGSSITAENIELPGTKHLKEFSEMFNKNMSLNEFQFESEKIFILKMLNDYKYNISQTASALQIQRSHLYKLLAKYNIPTPSRIKDS